MDHSSAHEEGWVICKVFKKKNLVVQHQIGQSTAVTKLTGAAAMEGCPSNCSSTVTISDHVKAQMQQLLHHSTSDDALDHILSSTTSCKQETKPTNPSSALDHLINNACPNGSTLYEKFIELQPLEHVVAGRLLPPLTEYGGGGGTLGNNIVVDWDTLNRLAAYELNDLSYAASTKTSGMSFFVDEHGSATAISDGTGTGDSDLWSLVRSVSSLHADLTINNV